MKKYTSLFDNGLIWFGAGVSIAEILTGTYFATLGWTRGIWAILLGHLIGGILLYLSGRIGGEVRKSSMETVKMSFGHIGGQFFAIMNIIQLVGWTAIMIYDGAMASKSILPLPSMVFCLIIGGLILLWIAIGITNLGRVNTVAMAALFLLTIVLCVVIISQGGSSHVAMDNSLSFGAAMELAISMPLSWLPVISDYTREAKKPKAATLVSVITYSIVSVWMFLIGMAGSIFTGNSDIAGILMKAGLGIIGLLIIVFSTVTTTFLDALSAGISGESITVKVNGKIPDDESSFAGDGAKHPGGKKLQAKQLAMMATIIGTIAAILYPMDNITNFLYFIGSVFAPMIAVMIPDYYLLHRDRSSHSVSWTNMLLWGLGFALYRYLMTLDLSVGYTLIDMLVTGGMTLLVGFIENRVSQKKAVQEM